MASEVISALFSAKDELSPTLQKVRANTQNVSQSMDSFQNELVQTSNISNAVGKNLQNVDNAVSSVQRSTRATTQSLDRFDRVLNEAAAGTVGLDSAFSQFDTTLNQASVTSKGTQLRLDRLGDELNKVSGYTNVTDTSLKSMQRSLITASGSSRTAANGLDSLSNSAGRAAIAKEALSRSVSRYNRRISTSIPTTAGATQQLGLLAAVAAQTSFEMSSLSINIGPFNLALKNLLLQLPAILVGLGSAVAVVSALAAAFVTAGAAAAGFIAGGLIKFLDDLGQEFDEAGQALEVFMAALKDLFKEAMEPLMTEANVDLFIASINTAARVVNRFAQFFEHMRDDVLGFFGEFSGDLDEMFNALERTFLRMEPILVRFINFLTDRAPGALEFFAERTEVILESLAMLAEGFRNLFNELLVFAGVVINAVAPVLAAVVVVLGEVFDFINRLDERIVTLVAQFVALALAGWKIHSMVTSVTGGFRDLSDIMQTQAAQSGALARMWQSTLSVGRELVRGNMSLSAAYKMLRADLAAHTNTLAGNIHMRLQEIPIIGAKLAAIWKLIVGLMTEQAIRADLIKTIKAHRMWTLSGMAAIIKETAATAASTAAYIAKQAAIWGTIGAVKILHAVTGGLTLALAAAVFAVISLAALMWELIQSAREGAGVFAHLKNAMMFLADVIIGVLVPPLNLLWSVLQLLAMPVRALANGLRAMSDVFGDASDEADESAGILTKIGDVVLRVVDAFGALNNILAIAVNLLSAVAEHIIIWVFTKLAEQIVRAVNAIRNFLSSISILNSAFSDIRQGADDAFGWMGEMIDEVRARLDRFIQQVEAVTGIDISGRFDADDVRASIRSDEEEEPEDDDFSSDPELDISFEESIEQNMDIHADPDDREMLRRTVKDAMNEANALQRRRE